MRNIAVLLLVLVTTATNSPAHATEYSSLAGPALAEFVHQDCGACHGITLKGGLGQPLTPDALEHLEIEAIRDMILFGIPGTAMPPWDGLLTSEQATWIAQKLKEGSLP